MGRVLVVHRCQRTPPFDRSHLTVAARPIRWEEAAIEGSRRPKKRWVQRDDQGGELREFSRREDLEEALEREVLMRCGVDV